VTGTGIDCGPGAGHSDCTETVDDGAAITLTAGPDANADFAGFAGGGCTTSPCTVNLDGDRSVDARFMLRRVSLEVEISGDGSGTVTSSPAGIDCGTTCDGAFDHGTTVTLTAHPDPTATFDGFTGPGCVGSELTCTVTVTAATTSVEARFSAVRLDSAAPETTISRVPKNPRPKRTHLRFFSPQGGATFTCQLDDLPPEPCRSPKVYRALSRGRHVFSVYATNAAGKVDPTPATATFRVKRAAR
jgi:hypothetical protein